MTAARDLDARSVVVGSRFAFGLDLSRYDRHPDVREDEAAALAELGPDGLRRRRATGVPRRTAQHWAKLTRLLGPLDAARGTLHHGEDARFRRAGAHAVAIILQNCADRRCSYWAWTAEDWADVCGPNATAFLAAQRTQIDSTVRPFVIAIGYLLSGFDNFEVLGTFNRLHLAQLVFGDDAVQDSLSRAGEILDGWGYRTVLTASTRMRGVFSQAMLLNRSPLLSDLDDQAFARLRVHPSTNAHQGEMLFALQRAQASLGYCDPPVRTGREHMAVIEGADAAWVGWLERWLATSTLTPKVRSIIRTIIAKMGRWLAAEHPEITEPSQWTRQTCAAWVAAVDRMQVGDYVQRRTALGSRAGKQIAPRTKAHMLMASRMFFRDCQEWEWIPRRFDPARALAVPRSVSALIGTDPRVIADDAWAKMLWAGLNLEPAFRQVSWPHLWSRILAPGVGVVAGSGAVSLGAGGA